MKSFLKDGACKKQGSIETRFLTDVARKFKQGEKNYTFRTSYDVGSEIGIWAFGSGVIAGVFVGNINKLKTGDYSIIGTVTYTFSDIFGDPYDTFNWTKASWDPNGTPYKISDTIIHKVHTVIYARNI